MRCWLSVHMETYGDLLTCTLVRVYMHIAHYSTVFVVLEAGPELPQYSLVLIGAAADGAGGAEDG